MIVIDFAGGLSPWRTVTRACASAHPSAVKLRRKFFCRLPELLRRRLEHGAAFT